MAYWRSQFVVYEGGYLVDSISQKNTSQGHYKLITSSGVGASKIREHWENGPVSGMTMINLLCLNT